MKGSILDVCVQGRNCLATRAIQQRGNHLWVFAQDRAFQIEKSGSAPIVINALV